MKTNTDDVRTLHLLYTAERYFNAGQKPLAVSLLVAAEQLIAEVSDPHLFLKAQCHADRLWKEYLIGTGLTASCEFSRTFEAV